MCITGPSPTELQWCLSQVTTIEINNSWQMNVGEKICNVIDQTLAEPGDLQLCECSNFYTPPVSKAPVSGDSVGIL